MPLSTTTKFSVATAGMATSGSGIMLALSENATAIGAIVTVLMLVSTAVYQLRLSRVAEKNLQLQYDELENARLKERIALLESKIENK